MLRHWYAQIIHQIMGQIKHVPFVSEATLLVDDFATENSLDCMLLDGDTYSESTGPDDIAVTSDSLLFRSSDYSTNHKGWLLCAEVVSAVGVLHVSTVTRESFDLWRTGWSTFVQVPLASVEPSKFLVRGDVRPYGGAPCARFFFFCYRYALMEVCWEATTWSYTAVHRRV